MQRQHTNDFNVIVMTDAGKLIFSRFDDDDEEDLSSFCGFVQAVSLESKKQSVFTIYSCIFKNF